jgi:heme oxygenase
MASLCVVKFIPAAVPLLLAACSNPTEPKLLLPRILLPLDDRIIIGETKRRSLHLSRHQRSGCMLSNQGGSMPDGLTKPNRSEIHQCLRDSTRADHLRIESALNLLDPHMSRGRYESVLAAFHSFYAPLEAQLRRFHRASSAPLGFTLPHRASLLAADLLAVGASRNAGSDWPLPEIRSVGEFAGRLYVVEGAALGGQILARMLAERWKLDRHSGAAFFYGAGPRETGRRWARVLSWLEGVSRSGAEADEIVAAASATFQSLERCVAAQVGPS